MQEMQEARVGSLAWEDAPGGGNGNTFQCSCLGEFHGQDKPGGLQAMRLKWVRYDWAHALKTLICSQREYIMMLTLWKSLAVSLIKHLCVLWPGGNSTPRYLLKRLRMLYSHKDPHVNICSTELAKKLIWVFCNIIWKNLSELFGQPNSFIDNNQKLERSHIVTSWIGLKKEMWYVHTTDYYSAVKRNELFIYATTRIHLKSLTLAKRTRCIRFHLHEILENDDRKKPGGC